MLKQFLLVGAGGFLGSSLRYAVSVVCTRFYPASVFPLSTLIINTTGCFAIGFIGGLAASKQILAGNGRLFIFTGILGGYTTFSAFGLETFFLMRMEHIRMALLNISLQLLLGLAGVALGHWLATKMS